jgi:hypothetical protein
MANIARIAALLNKAEHASTEEEAAAYFAKAQELATRDAIDIEVARAHKVTSSTQTSVLTERSFRLGEPRTKGLHTYVELFHRIARANDVAVAVAQNSTYIYAYGYDTDIDVVETLFVSLLGQMTQASARYLASGAYKSDTVYREGHYDRNYNWKPGGYRPVHGSTARISFQEAFAIRVGQRLALARKDAVSAVQQETPTSNGTGAELVLASKALAVRDHYQRVSGAKGSYKGGSNTARSRVAASAGREAGDRARISQAASIGGSRTAISA